MKRAFCNKYRLSTTQMHCIDISAVGVKNPTLPKPDVTDREKLTWETHKHTHTNFHSHNTAAILMFTHAQVLLHHLRKNNHLTPCLTLTLVFLRGGHRLCLFRTFV